MIDLSRPEHADKRAKFETFLRYLCEQLNTLKTSPLAQDKGVWTPERLRDDVQLLELMFWQKRQKFWALDEVPLGAWNNVVPIMGCMLLEVLPLMRKVYPGIKLKINNAYRTLIQNRSMGSGDDSLHRAFAAVDFHLSDMSGDKLKLAKYICDRLFVFGSTSILSMGLGMYGGFIHLDARLDRRSNQPGSDPANKVSWFHPPRTIRQYSGVLSLKDQLAGLKASELPFGADLLDFPKPLATQDVEAYTQRVREAQVVARKIQGRTVSARVASFVGLEAEGEVSTDVANIVHDRPDRQPLQIAGVNLADYLTPEEVRKGIIGEFFAIEDWHLTQLIGDDFKRENTATAITNQLKDTADRVAASAQAYANDDNVRNSLMALRADLSDDPRRRYVQSLVDAEFWRRRFRARSMPQVSTHFNPYVVSGFPSLIMLPDRPIIAHVSSVTHSINVSGASARTNVALGAPRYWDEGEPWHFLGGWGEADHNGQGDAFRRYWRRFPYWHNHLSMPTNTFTDEALTQQRETPLDRMYLHLLGCRAVPYMSNHAFVFRRADGGYNYDKMRSVIVDRETKGVDVNPSTLTLREHNRMVAETDSSGRFAPHTLAFRFWGAKRPEEPPERDSGRATDGAEFTERYGVKEQEFFVEFLGNKALRYRGYLVVTGPTFGGGGSGDKAISRSQQSVVDFCEDIRQVRSLGGGVK